MSGLAEAFEAKATRPALGCWRRPALVAAVWGLAIYLGLHPAPQYALIPVAALAAFLVLRHPPLGPLALVVSALLVPFALGTNTQTPLNAAILLVPVLLVLWLAKMIPNRSFRLAPSRAAAPLLGLVLAAGLSFLSGFLPWNPFASPAPIRAQVGAFAVFALSAGAFFLVPNQIQDLRWLRAMVGLFLGLGAIYIVGRAVPGFGIVAAMFPQGATGSVFWIWLVALACGQALFNQSLVRRWRAGLLMLTAAAFYVGLSGEARSWASGWLPGLVAVALLFWLRWPHAGVVLGLAGLVIGLINLPVVSQYVMTGDNDYSLLTRRAALEIVLKIVEANPLLGVGPANYYYYTPLYPILGWRVRFNSHNQYIDILAQTGLLGLGFFAWFVFEVGRLGWQLRNRFEAGFARAYVYSCLGGLVGTLVAGMLGDWLLPFVYNIGIAGFRASVLAWTFLGGLVAMEQVARQEAETFAS